MNPSRRKFSPAISVFLAVMLGCGAVLTLSSCAKKTSAAIVGKWRVQSTKETVEFGPDGTVSNPNPAEPEPKGR